MSIKPPTAGAMPAMRDCDAGRRFEKGQRRGAPGPQGVNQIAAAVLRP